MATGIISRSTSGALLAAAANFKFQVFSYVLSTDSAVNLKFQSGTADLTGLLYMADDDHLEVPGIAGGDAKEPLFETKSGCALNLNMSSGVACGGHFIYEKVYAPVGALGGTISVAPVHGSVTTDFAATITASGGAPNYAWAITDQSANSIATGTAWDGSSLTPATFNLASTVTSLILTITDSAGNTGVSVAFPVTVLEVPTISVAPTTGIHDSTAFVSTIVATGGQGLYSYVIANQAAVAIASGVHWNGASLPVTHTFPAGTTSVHVTVTDFWGATAVSTSFSVTVS